MSTRKARKYTESQRHCRWVLNSLLFLICLCSCDKGLRKENERLREELAKTQQYVPLHRGSIHDTVEVVTQKIVEVERVKEALSKEDRQLLKDLSLKVSELESYQKMSNVIRDTVRLVQRDSLMEYHDTWTDFTYKEGLLSYRLRDSLAIAVKKQHKHKFLWWRWGTKGYEVKVVNHNPHASIRYNTFVKRKE